MNTPWRIEMLGWMRAQSGDLTVTRFRTQKTALLLARLALFPKRIHPREELADLLWPEANQDAGRNNLKQSLAILRRLLEPPGTPAGSMLVADRGAVRLNPAAFSTDVADFEAALRDAARSPEGRHEALATARSLYRGELLPGVYDDWVVEERERLIAASEEASEEAPEQSGGAAPAPDQTVPISPHPAALHPDARPTAPRLPMTFTRFFGRERERADLAALLGDESVRLVTLTGPGGTGKTRLALEAARQAAATLGGQVYFVPVADLTDPRLIPEAVADALGLPRTTTGEPLDRIVAALCAAPALLVLDNLEQLGEGAAAPLLTLLTRVPSLTILATSRARLFLAGEQEYPLSPLPTPQDGQGGPPLSPESLLTFPGVQLFADRARAARPDFQITARNAPAVADVCRGLEGIPLALELAAAWSSLLTPAQMCDRLAERFTLLRSRRKGVTERHQTLRAAIAWSYDLLPPDLARFWARLSVFRGGWTVEATQAVCEEPRALDYLGRLRAYSLVTSEAAGDEMRFRLLESLREFGWAQLGEDERRVLADCHASHFLHWAEATEPDLRGLEAAAWLDRWEADHDNLRATVERYLGPQGDAGAALRMTSALWWFWRCHLHLREGRAALEAALSRETGPEMIVTRADALNGAGVLARQQQDFEAARRFVEEALCLKREAGDPSGLYGPLTTLGNLMAEMGDYAAARTAHLECLHLKEECADRDGVMRSLNNLTNTMLRLKDYDAAADYNRRSLTLSRGSGNATDISSAMQHRALIQRRRGRLEAALESQRECIGYTQAAGDRGRLCDNLEEYAALLCLLGREERGVWLYASTAACRAATGLRQQQESAAESAGHLAAALERLGADEYERFWTMGRSSPMEEAVASALEEPSAAAPGHGDLTDIGLTQLERKPA